MIETYSIILNASIKEMHYYEFRGAFLDLLRKTGIENSLLSLFTNKRDIGNGQYKLIQRYAPIQCRNENGLASIWAINADIREGQKSWNPISVMKNICDNKLFSQFNINGTHVPLQIIDTNYVKLKKLTISDELSYEYVIYDYLPFNEEKIKLYQNETSLVNKIVQIEELLRNEIVLFGYLYQNKEDIKVGIEQIIKEYPISYKTKNKGQKITQTETGFVLKFRTNIELPDRLSLGRHKAYGYGVIKKVPRHDQSKNEK